MARCVVYFVCHHGMLSALGGTAPIDINDDALFVEPEICLIALACLHSKVGEDR
jgi:hypothetical protein